MAKLKKNARVKHASKPKTSNAAELQAKAEQLSRSLVESAQQIWTAGIGALTRAQGEGTRLFEGLVKEGMHLEQNTRKLATGKVDAVRDAVEDRVGVVRERASDTWDRLEKVFEDRVQRALNRLGVPSREDLLDLVDRVDALTTQLRQSSNPSVATAKRIEKRAAKPVQKAPQKRIKKAPPTKKPARKTLPKAIKPVSPQA